MKTTISGLILASLLLLFSISTFGQEQEAPVNPEFLLWQQNVLNGNSNTGEIPFYVEPGFNGLSKKNKDVLFDQIYDLRNEGYVTPVKDQGSCTVCWTFAALGSIESYMLKNGFGTFDFSEQNMRTCHGFVLTSSLSCSGGSAELAAAYLTRLDGPVNESYDVYDEDMNATCTNGLPVNYRVTQFKLLPNDPTIVKQAILDYGGLYTNMMYDATYYNSTNYTYYYNGTNSTDHAVLLVGWDDTKVTVGGTGAWIIKNSWSSSWGENGYFYISYNDTKILSTVGVYPGVEQINANDKIYMIDELGWISDVGYGYETAYGLIKYVAEGSESLNAVGVYVNTEATTVNISIYDDMSGNTLSNLLSTVGPTLCDYPGYHKINLSTPVTLSAGNDFYIKVEYNTPGCTYPIPIERYSSGYADPDIEAGMCWISSSGNSWTQVGNDVPGKERDLCIRAYTENNNSAKQSHNLSGKNIQVYPQPASDQINIINIPTEESCRIDVISTDGKTIIKKHTKHTKNLTLQVSELHSGLYFIRIIDQDGKLIYHNKWIKE